MVRIRNLVGKKERELQIAKANLQACINNPPPPPPPPPDTIPGVPDECVPVYRKIEKLTFEWHQLQDALAGADPSDRARIRNLVGAKERELSNTKAIFNTCIDPPIKAPIGSDTTLKPVQKMIAWSLLQKKWMKFLITE